MSSVVKYIFGLSLVALVAVACSTKLPREEPLAVSPVQFFGPELREVSNLFIVTDASGTMWTEKTFPTAKALSTSFVRALPDANARSASSDYNVGYIAFGGDDRVAGAVAAVRSTGAARRVREGRHYGLDQWHRRSDAHPFGHR